MQKCLNQMSMLVYETVKSSWKSIFYEINSSRIQHLQKYFLYQILVVFSIEDIVHGSGDNGWSIYGATFEGDVIFQIAFRNCFTVNLRN